MGKVLLAYNPEQADELLRGSLRSLTGDTITDPAELIVQFALIAERGLATEKDEVVLGESSIAAPVVDSSGVVIAAVAVVLPTSEWPPEDSIINDLRETARNISRELGATNWPPLPEKHLIL
jgi:DNA-binding IclR family transcriptional regulator